MSELKLHNAYLIKILIPTRPNTQAKSKSGSKDGKRSGSPLKAISKQSAPKPAAARQLELSPTRKPDVKYGLKSPRYFTSPENEDIDFKKSSRRYGIFR